MIGKRNYQLQPSYTTLGYKKKEILDLFYNFSKFDYNKSLNKWKTKFDPNYFKVNKLQEDLVDAKKNKIISKSGTKISFLQAKKFFEEGLKEIYVSNDFFIGKYLHKSIIDETGEILFNIGTEINQEFIDNIIDKKILSFDVTEINNINKGPYLIKTLLADKNKNKEEAINDIYRVLRPGEPPTAEIANQIFNNLFFRKERYDLSDVGRVKMNSRLDLTCSDKITILRNEDILAIIQVMLDLRDGKNEVDDIDHLGNRRVRSVGELVENQSRIGIFRMERAIKEKMSTVEIESAMPQDLINAKPLTMSLKDFFGTSQLSQFMDQTNPLSEITHKRRVSALGPGGLTRERAGFEVRDVHPTHYGRICPIETPEGPNIGLINSLSTYSRINKIWVY